MTTAQNFSELRFHGLEIEGQDLGTLFSLTHAASLETLRIRKLNYVDLKKAVCTISVSNDE